MVCGSTGCTPLPTSTLQGLLTLPEALQPADPPPAQPFLLFRVDDLDGAMHQVVYVPRDGGALLGFAGGPRWRLVPADDAKLLVDAVAGATPYPAPAAGTPVGMLFAADERSRWSSATPRGRCSRPSASECWESRRTRRSPWFPVGSGSQPAESGELSSAPGRDSEHWPPPHPERGGTDLGLAATDPHPSLRPVLLLGRRASPHTALLRHRGAPHRRLRPRPVSAPVPLRVDEGVASP